MLNLLTTFFHVCGSKYSSFVGSCLNSLAELRSSANFSFTNELDYVIGKAIRTMGPEVVLSHIPLHITGEEQSYDFPRSWLLPVLRENVQNANLAYFKNTLLPVAKKCKLRIDQLPAEDKIGRKSYEMIISQLWALLPGFCNNPKDLPVAFGDIVNDLGRALEKSKDLRMFIMASLRQLLLKSVTDDENKKVLSKWSFKFLKTLYDLYIAKPSGAEEAGQRSSMMETIRLFLPLIDSKEQGQVFDKVLNMYTGQKDHFIKDALHDLIRVMLRFQEQDRIDRIYQMSANDLTSKDHKKQKKAYKMLEEICTHQDSGCHVYLLAHFNDIQTILIESLSKASAPSQTSRLKCLISIIQSLDQDQNDQKQFVYKGIPEAVLCVKATNEKARSGAYTLLVTIGEALLRFRQDDSVENVLKDYMKVLLAGLAGGPTMIHCTLKALARVFFEFKDLFPDELIEMVVENLCLLVTSQSREVVLPCVSFLRVIVTTCKVERSARFCEKIVNALCKMTDDCKRHSRQTTRYLFDRLVRKFGYDVIKSFIPKDDEMTLKRLKNIKKIQAKKKRDDEANEDSDNDDEMDEFRIKAKPKTIDEILAASEVQDSDNEDMDDDESKKKVVRRKKKSATYIAEENRGEDIVDFLDTTAAQKLRSSLPKANDGFQAKSKKKSEFEIAPDGRLIIMDSEEEEEQPRKPKGYELEDSDDENDENNFEALVSNNARKRKRGTSVASSKVSEPAMKYRAGGSGIHRPLNADSKKTVKEFGTEYKATKAKGDVKRKGKPDPYAYVPLQKSSLNRRKKAKYEGQFKGLVKAANAGSVKGKKAKKMSVMTQLKNVKI